MKRKNIEKELRAVCFFRSRMVSAIYRLNNEIRMDENKDERDALIKAVGDIRDKLQAAIALPLSRVMVDELS